MSRMSIEKKLTIIQPFENGLRNGGGRIKFDSETNEVEIWYDDKQHITLDLPKANNLNDALSAVTRVAREQGFE